MKKGFPLFVYCAPCRTCALRNFKNLFDDKSMLECADCNGLSVKTVIPFILWKIERCKKHKKKKNDWKEII